MSSLFGEQLFGDEPPPWVANGIDFRARLVECLPPPYRPTDFNGFNVREFLERLLTPTGEDLARVVRIFEEIDTYLRPESAPEEWLRWLIVENMGWTLIPENYPVDSLGPDITSSPCLRRLLLNLHRHYKRRYTVRGIQELLREFGVIADVYDGAIYYGSYYGSYGSRHPLAGRIRVLGYEPIDFPQRTFYGGYYGGTFYYESRVIVTRAFVESLVSWSRPAGVDFMIEWVAPPVDSRATRPIPDDDEIILPFAS